MAYKHVILGMVAVVVLQNVCICSGAKILGIFPFEARSHSFVTHSLIKELARRGHEVTVITHNPQTEKVANYKDIVVKTKMTDFIAKARGGGPMNFFDNQDQSPIRKSMFLWWANTRVCEQYLEEEAIQKLIQAEDQQFDVVITEAFFNECLLGFAHKFKAPLIYICSFGGTHWMGDWVGNPTPYAYVPDFFLEYSDKMSFWQRTVNTLIGTFWRLGRYYYYIPGQDAIMRKHFNNTVDLPHLRDIEYSTSLLLVNHHFSISYARPLMPNLVQVGGLHVKAPKALPQDIKKYLDDAPDGVIYFSMGSNLKSADLPNEKRDALLKVFSELKQQVLWKWETDVLPGQPKNVKLGKWLPQSDILAHPNVRLFITHGGLLGTQEAITHGVPLLGIPVFGDQRLNMARAEDAGFGITLSFHNITTESVRWALTEAINNNKYRENAKRLSGIYRDQPMTPMETAVFWTEYVIRHKGAPHMRSAVLDLAWYQYFLLDVIAVLALTAIVVLFVLFVVFRSVYRLICGRKNAKSKKKSD